MWPRLPRVPVLVALALVLPLATGLALAEAAGAGDATYPASTPPASAAPAGAAAAAPAPLRVEGAGPGAHVAQAAPPSGDRRGGRDRAEQGQRTERGQQSDQRERTDPLPTTDRGLRSDRDQEPDGRPPLSEKDRQELEEALGVYSTIVTVYPGTREARQADLAAARCLEQLGRLDQATERYERFLERYRGMPEGAGALLSLARLYAFRRNDVPHALTLYDRVLSEYSFAPESIAAQIDKAGCLRDRGRLGEALRLYEEVAERYTGTEYAARALVGLGLYYQSRDERDRARFYYGKTVEECPAESRWTRMALSRLDSLGRYHFSPLYDRLMWRIERDLLVGLLHLDRLSSLSVLLKLGLTQCLVRWGALALCLILMWACSWLAPATPAGSGVLRRRWSAGRMALLLTALWSFDLALTVISTAATWRWFPQSSFRPVLGSLQEISIYLIMIAAVMWKESPVSALGVSRAQAWRTAALCAGAGVVIVAGLGVINEVHGRLAQAGSVAAAQPWVPRMDHGATWGGAIVFYFYDNAQRAQLRLDNSFELRLEFVSQLLDAIIRVFPKRLAPSSQVVESVQQSHVLLAEHCVLAQLHDRRRLRRQL